jgi:hypothetical protein
VKLFNRLGLPALGASLESSHLLSPLTTAHKEVNGARQLWKAAGSSRRSSPKELYHTFVQETQLI